MSKWMKRSGLLFVMALVLVLSTACGSSKSGTNGGGSSTSSKSGTSSSSGTSNSGTSSSSGSSSSSSQVSGKITVGGSTALQPLAAAAAQTFQKNNPNAQISVQGGGSGTGLSQVAAGNFDIGDSDIFKEQKSGLQNASQLVDHKVCVVGMAPAINAAAGVSNVTQKQLIDIWSGKITNWKTVGGKDMKITLINRPQGSGTRATFTQFAINGNTVEAPNTTTLKQDSNGTVQKMLDNTPGAMGYLAFSYLKGDSKIQAVSIDGVAPTAANIETNKWKVWAYEHMYTKGAATGLTKAFINYMMTSSDVQSNLVTAQGYIPITAMKVTRDATGKVSQQ